MKNSTQKTEQDPLDSSFCHFSIIDDEIKLNTNFKDYDDMLELLNIIVNTDFIIESIMAEMSDEQKNKIISDLKSMKRKPGPFITPLSQSSS